MDDQCHSDEFVFIPDQEIARLYKARGSFYDLLVPWQSFSIRCRNVLEIYDTRLHEDELQHLIPDAYFVMMNPGSSEPLHLQPMTVNIGDIDEVLLHPAMVEAKPDKTQYQVMRLMRFARWKFVRILNLSDIREASSTQFYKEYRKYEEMYQHYDHSIFSPNRHAERETFLPLQEDVPVIAGWGVHRGIKPLADRYFASIQAGRTIIGWRKEGNLYYHPLPRRQQHVVDWCSTLSIAITPFRRDGL